MMHEKNDQAVLPDCVLDAITLGNAERLIMPVTTNTRELNRELLRQAAEHLGALAEQAHELAWASTDARRKREYAERYAALVTLSRRVLEIANG